jgi:hypothetical protein
VDGRLDHARGLVVAGRERAAVRLPEVDARKIRAEVRVEDDLGQEAVLPLAVEEVVQLPFGAGAQYLAEKPPADFDHVGLLVETAGKLVSLKRHQEIFV